MRGQNSLSSNGNLQKPTSASNGSLNMNEQNNEGTKTVAELELNGKSSNTKGKAVKSS